MKKNKRRIIWLRIEILYVKKDTLVSPFTRGRVKKKKKNEIICSDLGDFLA